MYARIKGWFYNSNRTVKACRNHTCSRDFPGFLLPTANCASFLKMNVAHTLPTLPNWHLPSRLFLLHPLFSFIPTTSFPRRDTPAPQLSDSGFSGFSPDVDQTPVNNTGQVTPSRLAVYWIFFLKKKKNQQQLVLVSQFLVFPFFLQLHPVHSLSARIFYFL